MSFNKILLVTCLTCIVGTNAFAIFASDPQTAAAVQQAGAKFDAFGRTTSWYTCPWLVLLNTLFGNELGLTLIDINAPITTCWFFPLINSLFLIVTLFYDVAQLFYVAIQEATTSPVGVIEASTLLASGIVNSTEQVTTQLEEVTMNYINTTAQVPSMTEGCINATLALLPAFVAGVQTAGLNTANQYHNIVQNIKIACEFRVVASVEYKIFRGVVRFAYYLQFALQPAITGVVLLLRAIAGPSILDTLSIYIVQPFGFIYYLLQSFMNGFVTFPQIALAYTQDPQFENGGAYSGYNAKNSTVYVNPSNS